MSQNDCRLCSKKTFLQENFAPRRLCSKKTLFQEDFVPRRLCPKKTFLQEDFVPRRLCSKKTLFQEDFAPRRVCSKKTLFQEDFAPRTKVYPPGHTCAHTPLAIFHFYESLKQLKLEIRYSQELAKRGLSFSNSWLLSARRIATYSQSQTTNKPIRA